MGGIIEGINPHTHTHGRELFPKINPSTIPGLKPGGCSGLIRSGRFHLALMAGVWRRRSINQI
jgi:hypothetical protein